MEKALLTIADSQRVLQLIEFDSKEKVFLHLSNTRSTVVIGLNDENIVKLKTAIDNYITKKNLLP